MLDKLKSVNGKTEIPFNHFDWKLDFPEVLNPYLVNSNGGFDIVIGNPPYVGHERLGHGMKISLKSKYPEVANGMADLYIYFFALGLGVLKKKEY